MLPGDAHLGAPNRSGALLEVLESLPEDCNIIILGDFFDSHHIKRLKKTDIGVIEHLKSRKVNYVLGNHDRFLEIIELDVFFKDITKDWGLHYSNFRLEIKNNKYYFEHGDRFDLWSTKWKPISAIGSRLYTLFKLADGEKPQYSSDSLETTSIWKKIVPGTWWKISFCGV